MKKVISGDELKNKIEEAIDLLCNTVKSTLGPKGSNVIIDHSTYSPIITNDGVTIAKNIESDDIVINTILELAKESTIKTNDDVGDGTTTTLVLLESIFNYGKEFIEEGYNPIMLKNEIDKVEEDIINRIELKSKKPSNKELLDIATISSSDKEIGKNIYTAFMKVKDKNSISLKEGADTTFVNEINGYIIDTALASPYFLNNNELIYEDCYILLSDDVIYSTISISDILNYIKSGNKKLVILSNDYEDSFVNEILSLVINDKYSIALLKNPLYAEKSFCLLNDLSAISSAKINHSDYSIDSLGFLERVKIEKEKVIFNFSYNGDIKVRIKELENILVKEKDDYERDFYKNSISMLKNKNIEIIVGGRTKVERREKIMRYEDALSSISSSYNGIVVGSGLVFYEISEELSMDNIGNKVLKEALKSPLKQIIINSGVNEEVIKNIVDSNFNIIYNALTNSYENINNTNIFDSTEVLKSSFLNASSVAKMLLTTTSIVINEYDNKIIDNYNNL